MKLTLRRPRSTSLPVGFFLGSSISDLGVADKRSHVDVILALERERERESERASDRVFRLSSLYSPPEYSVSVIFCPWDLR